MSTITVVDSPWRNELPDGTEVVRVKAPIKMYKSSRSKEKTYTDDWYKRADGKAFGDRNDNLFRLFSTEVEEVE